jgi:hypothetical protein
MQGTGPAGQQAILLTGIVTVTITGLTTAGSTPNSADTGISSTQAMWLTGYELGATTGGLAAIQSVYMNGPGSSATWQAQVVALGLEAGTTDASVRVFYTYTA